MIEDSTSAKKKFKKLKIGGKEKESKRDGREGKNLSGKFHNGVESWIFCVNRETTITCSIDKCFSAFFLMLMHFFFEKIERWILKGRGERREKEKK